MENNKIQFRKKRDIGDIINVTFSFIKEHFVHFLSMQVLISLPFALIAIILISVIPTSDLFTVDNFSKNIGQNIISILVYAMAGFSLLVFLVSAVYQYTALYMKKGTYFSITELYTAILSNFWVMSQTYIFLTFVMIGVYIGIGLLAALFFTMGGAGAFLGGIWVFVGVLASIYFFIPLSFVFVIRSFEPEKSFWASLKRAQYLVKDNWWACFGLSFITGIIQAVIIGVMKIPFAIFGMADITQVNFTGALSVAIIVELITRMITSFLPTLAATFQYFSLVEMKDATGLNEQVEKFGTVANNDENEDEKEDY